ncbi:secreted protein, partial [gut metagenome]
ILNIENQLFISRILCASAATATSNACHKIELL